MRTIGNIPTVTADIEIIKKKKFRHLKKIRGYILTHGMLGQKYGLSS